MQGCAREMENGRPSLLEPKLLCRTKFKLRASPCFCVMNSRLMNWAWMLFVYVKAIAIQDQFNVEMTSCFNVVRKKRHNWGKTIRSSKIYGNRLLLPFNNNRSYKVSCLKLVTTAALITTNKVRHKTRVYSSCLTQFGLFFLPEKGESEGNRFL